MPREESFAARLKPDDDGAEAWTLVAPEGPNLLVIQHALRLMPKRTEAQVRAAYFTGSSTRAKVVRAEVTQAVVDPERLRTVWNGSSLSLEEVYGAAEGWRWRIRATTPEAALLMPPLLRDLADAHISYPVLQLPFTGEWQQEDGAWRPLSGTAMMVHRSSPQGARPWGWLALPRLENGGTLAASVMRLPGLPLRPVLGWWRWQDSAQAWPGGLTVLGRQFVRQGQGWRLALSLNGKHLELELEELANVRLEETLGGSIQLSHVQAELNYGGERTRGYGVLEWLSSED